jgi:uncharacterized protein (DUF952 family)
MIPDTYILHLASTNDWLAAIEIGAYRADSLSTEGFIHCSKPTQVVDVANRFYRGQHGLVLLVIDPSKLESGLKWEPPAHPNGERAAAMGDEQFPHIYGPINLDAVVRVVSFEPDASGNFNLPEMIP